MKILFLDIDGVLNSTASTLVKVGAYLRTGAQNLAIQQLLSEFGDEDGLPYGPSFTIDTIDPVCVGLVNRLLAKDQEVRIVLSSSHRSMFCGSNYGDSIEFGTPHHLELLRIYLRALGLVGTPLQLCHDVTPRLFVPRGDEVRTWLERNDGLNITHHCAVDDSGDFKSSDCVLVRTDARLGLQSSEYFRIANHLNIVESTIIC